MVVLEDNEYVYEGCKFMLQIIKFLFLMAFSLVFFFNAVGLQCDIS